MADRISVASRSRLMARIRGTDTKPEWALRRALWAAGLRYRLRPKLPGKPDLIFPRAKVAVFVDGCFWHGCSLHGHQPKSNVAYWETKLARNLARDSAVDASLIAMGWIPLRVWEHDVKDGLDACLARITEAVRLRTRR